MCSHGANSTVQAPLNPGWPIIPLFSADCLTARPSYSTLRLLVCLRLGVLVCLFVHSFVCLSDARLSARLLSAGKMCVSVCL